MSRAKKEKEWQRNTGVLKQGDAMASVDAAASTTPDSGDHPSPDSPQLQRPSKVPRIEEQVMNPPRPGLQRYLVAFEYIGTRFFGSQQQTNQRTAVGVLQVSKQL